MPSITSQPSVSILNPADYPAWDAFVAADPVGDLLQTSAWGQLKSHSGWRPSVLAARDGESIRAGIMVMRRSLPLGRSLMYAPRGPVGDWGDAATMSSVLRAAADYARSQGAIVLKVDPPWEEPGAAETLKASGFHSIGGEGGFGGTQPRCVMQLDTGRPLDGIIASFHQKWRYNIRVAEKKGVNIRLCDDRADLAIFFKLYEDTARRDGFVGRRLPYFEQMWDALVPHGWMRLFLGDVDGEPVCGALSYLFGDKCWYTYGASSNVHREKMPNYLMQWRMISWAQEHGCRWYDFRGVSCTPDDPDDKTAGLNRFKAGFNPRFVKYIGEFDLPLNAPAYWAFTKAMPRVRAWMKGRRGKEEGQAAEA